MKAPRKKFKLSYYELCLFTSQLVANMTRDATEFAARGVDGTAITALETLGDAFEVFPPDDVYVGDISDLTTEKNNLRETVTDDIQVISGYFEQQWGPRSGKYKSLRIANIQKMSDSKFLFTSRNVVTQATQYLTELTPIGLTQTMIDSLEDNAQLFEDKLVELNNTKELRDEKAEERLTKGNELYDYVANYCRIGKLIWENLNEAKYNDYVIYPSVQTGLSKPQNVAAEYVAGSPPLIHISWDSVLNATSYDLYYDLANLGGAAGDFQLLNTYTDTFADVEAVDNKRNYFKLRAKNAEHTSDYSNEVFVDVEIT